MWRSVAMEVCHNIEPTTVTAVKETWNNLVTVFRRRVNEIKGKVLFWNSRKLIYFFKLN